MNYARHLHSLFANKSYWNFRWYFPMCLVCCVRTHIIRYTDTETQLKLNICIILCSILDSVWFSVLCWHLRKVYGMFPFRRILFQLKFLTKYFHTHWYLFLGLTVPYKINGLFLWRHWPTSDINISMNLINCHNQTNAIRNGTTK